MIKVAIIDDEVPAIALIQHACSQVSVPVSVSGTSTTIAGGKKLLREEQPDLVLLDVEFPEGTGFDVLEGNTHSEVIFITGHEDYAIKAIRHRAFDYLLKPIDIASVKNAIEEAVQRINEQRPREPEHEVLQHSHVSMSGTRFALPIKDGYRYILLDDLVYIKADGSYAQLHMRDGERIIISKKLAWFEQRLPGHSFVRAHRSFLVNQSHILEFHRNDGGYILTTTNERIQVSRSVIRQIQ